TINRVTCCLIVKCLVELGRAQSFKILNKFEIGVASRRRGESFLLSHLKHADATRLENNGACNSEQRTTSPERVWVKN
ncbi:Hypothetical predicted protein, partial [Scomber scombrus]